MMSSMTAAISGLKAHQTRMDVISNNIANVNTVGYKASRVTFREAYNKQLSTASAANEELGTGGTNPTQVGIGVAINTISTNFSSGSIETTENSLDVAIDGEGFLIVKNNLGGEFFYTRAGSLGVDAMGNLVTSSGAQVYGWPSYEKKGSIADFNEELEVQPINLYHDEVNGNKNNIEPKATSFMELDGNINLDTSSEIVIPTSIYDSYGTEYVAKITFVKNATNNWTYTISDGTGTQSVFDDVTGTLEFDDTPGNVGNLLTVNDENGDALPGNIIPAELGIKSANGGIIKMNFDFTRITQYDSETSAGVYDVDGYTAGELVDYSVGEDGVVTGVYSNGEQQPLAKIALAVFKNEQGLKRNDGGLYSVTQNSGLANVISAKSVAGSFIAGSLELSNVDLSTEFTDMIITQRGFQANSKIISTSDELLQELVNLKR